MRRAGEIPSVGKNFCQKRVTNYVAFLKHECNKKAVSGLYSIYNICRKSHFQECKDRKLDGC